MQQIYDYFSSFSYHDYTPPVDSTEECVICLMSLSEASEGVFGAVAHNDFNPHIEARQIHLHKVHRKCIIKWIQTPDREKTRFGHTLCPNCKSEVDYTWVFPFAAVPEVKEVIKRMTLRTLVIASIAPTLILSSGVLDTVIHGKFTPFISSFNEKEIIKSVGIVAQQSCNTMWSVGLHILAGTALASVIRYAFNMSFHDIRVKELAELVAECVLAYGLLELVGDVLLEPQ